MIAAAGATLIGLAALTLLGALLAALGRWLWAHTPPASEPDDDPTLDDLPLPLAVCLGVAGVLAVTVLGVVAYLFGSAILGRPL